MKLPVLLLVILSLSAFSEANVSLTSQGILHMNQSLDISLCEICNNFISNGINQLLNAILKGGIAGGCSEICSNAFPTKKSEQGVCNMICDAVGVYAFVQLVEKYSGYLDPIYFCELVKVCTIHEGGSARLDNLIVKPESGPSGTTFDIDISFTVLNQTSTGELEILIVPPNSKSFGTAQFDEGFAPGKYSVKFSIQTHPTEEEPFEIGNYAVNFAACDGECGSKLPHSALLFEASGNFTITAH